MNVEDLPIAVLVLDAKRVIISANDAAGAMAGTEPKKLVGLTIFDAFRPRTLAGQDLLKDDWHSSAKLRGTRRFNEHDVIIRRVDGTEAQVIVDGGYERAPSGELLGATLLMRPRHRGQRRPRSGVRIVSAVSHELRSPLTSVRGYTSLLLKQWDKVGDDDRKAMLQQIDRDARRISRMIGELLDISRLEAGRLQLNRIELDLEKVVRSVTEKVAMTYPALECEVSFPEDYPPVWADPDKIDQVLTNLVENACKYADPKGIIVEGSFNGSEAVVEVHDQGPGIPPTDLPRLFQQFFRSSEGRPTGTGLGLWISRGLIEAHGGLLSATSDGATGTTFRFTLPQRAFEDLHGRLTR